MPASRESLRAVGNKLYPDCRLRDASPALLPRAAAADDSGNTNSFEGSPPVGDLDARRHWLASRGNVRKVVGCETPVMLRQRA